MNYISLNKKAIKTTFKNAVINGLAPDRGLYFPENIPSLSPSFIENINSYSNEEIAYKVIQPFIGNEIPADVLKEIVKETINFEFPITPLDENTASLELFHGPTMAFKDVGARFMARCLQYFNKDNTEEITVLVATSGDTGGAVADGFLNVKGVQVVILYPSGKVSDIQEKQLTTLGSNITALEVDGVFDDCQNMVKTAFLDAEINRKLTSANSINIARWLPQMFYFFFAYKELHKKHKDLVFSVPSGNFGNICAGLMAKKIGLPIKHFVASTNKNDTVPNYMNTDIYIPKASIATISNAMDVGDPSNFIRIQALFNNDFKEIKKGLSSYSYTDDETKKAMKDVYLNSKYILDPHGAVGYLGFKEYSNNNDYGVILETAHPIKFMNIVEKTINKKLIIPEKIAKIIMKTKKSIPIKNYDELKNYLNE